MNIQAIFKEMSGAPSTFQLFPYGIVEIEGEAPIFLDHDSMDNIIHDFERRGNDMVIDYEHQTLKDIQAPAAGWIRKLVNRGTQGLFAVVEWTEKAKNYLMNREYRYFSPVLILSKGDRKILQIMNVGLTNAPKINHLNSIVAKAASMQSGNNFQKGESLMNQENDPGELLNQKAMELLTSPDKKLEHGLDIEAKLSYGQALDIVAEENPELAKRYLGILSATKSDPDELLHAKTMELLENSKDLSYGEALDIVAKNNMDLTERYLLGG